MYFPKKVCSITPNKNVCCPQADVCQILAAHLLVSLHLASHHSKGIIAWVVVNLDPAESLGARAGRDPLLIAVIVDHHSGPRLTDT